MKSAMMIIAACLVILFLPATILAINNFRSLDYPENHIVVTDPGETTADVTLVLPVFNNRVQYISVASNEPDDAPLVLSYAPATKVVSLDGLKADATRVLVITYKISALDDYFAADLGARTWGIFLVLGVIGIIAGAVYNAQKHGE